MIPHEQLHLVYVIICTILLISIIIHLYIYKQIPIPCDKSGDKKDYGFYVNKAHEGMFRGILFGMLLDGDPIIAIRNSAIYGTINPLIAYMGIV
jgi:hypothetical protein